MRRYPVKRLSAEQKMEAIEAYIKKNTSPLTCSKCKATSGLLEDKNFGTYTDKVDHLDIFCLDCLKKSLLKDLPTLRETYSEMHPEEL
jgi:hypothetical protein